MGAIATVMMTVMLGGAFASPLRMTAPSPAPVVVIVMENHGYAQIVGSASAPYLNRTFIPAGRLFTRYRAITHPSLPNYLAMTSGSQHGCTTDSCRPNSFGANNLFNQLDRVGIRWSVWEDSMPKRCANADSGAYVVRHDPPPYFTDLVSSGTCRKNDVAYPSALPALAPFTFITPNICHDMHSCGVSTGDRWLSRHVPDLLAAGAIVVITFDEGTTSSNSVMTAEVGRASRRVDGAPRDTRITACLVASRRTSA
jgi:hypothetical protein